MFSGIRLACGVSAVWLAILGMADVRAQTPPPFVPIPSIESAPASTAVPQAPKPEGSGLLVQVEVVLLRFQGEKKIGSLPYTLYVVPGSSNSSLRFGQNVPIVQAAFSSSSAGGGQMPTTRSVSYQSVGTNIDVNGFRVRADGRYEFVLAVSSSFLYPVPTTAAAGPQTLDQPVIGTYTVNTPLIARDGQTIAFSVATDKITGETIRAEVTVAAVK